MFEGVLRGRLFPIAYSVPLSEDNYSQEHAMDLIYIALCSLGYVL